MRQIYFIINPKAGNGHCLKVWQRIEAILQAQHVSFLAFFTEYPGHAIKLADHIASRNNQEKLVVAVGGDGTMHEVMNGTIKHNYITLGFIPGGSGNDFSRGFQIPSVPDDALKVLLRLMKQKPTMIDAGKMTMQDESEHYFINNMGAGFDALIAYKVNHSRVKAMLNKLSLGRLVYVYFLIKELFTYKTSVIELSIDGKRHRFEQTWFVTVSNQPYYGGGMMIAPTAQPDDGLFDVTVVHQLSRLKLLLVFLSVFKGKHIYFKEVKTFKGKTISIQSSANMFVHGDGEHIGYTPLYIEIQVKALEMFTRLRNKEDAELKEGESNDIR
ncbi:diacylglycerol kinase family protein [Bacillus sp. FJAT-29814]|uniref:diacylglycerol/lipid kinase family protein n=1 Tax=Bacillus sp. FJAT-29814 TaxID=1729688 RepID=UPI00083130D5|nr:diacylglycerol kinase family protein [Bacillus sp. FJAT-29814]